jgi:hypothetical protein
VRSSSATATIGRHTVGNALVLHARERISSEAQSLALAVDEDAENDIVVLDLHDDLPVGIWESVAGALHRRRRGIRLVICGAGQDTTVLAGQWLSDRLGRSVVAPYGHMIRGASGGLFVHAAEGSGWVRYSPGKPPVWEAKRYPRPAWDGAAAEFLPTSAVGAVEPIPGGVWIRDTRDVAAVGEHWQRLAGALPCQPQSLTVVLGCPGTPPLALDNVARFWRELDVQSRGQARFIHYGPVQLPQGEPLGQALADLLEGPIVCFTGVPIGRPDRPQMHTVTLDGALGWQVFARELAYTPREKPSMRARMPRILSHRAPVMLGEATAPLVYRYADDAVVEIVQSGLWIRDAVAPKHAERVRARAADPALHAIVVDDANPSRVVRYRELAEDLVARLDPATRERSTLHLASAVVKTDMRGPVAAGGVVPDGLTYQFSAADLALEFAAEFAAAPAGHLAPPPAEELALPPAEEIALPPEPPAAEQLVGVAVSGPEAAPAEAPTGQVAAPPSEPEAPPAAFAEPDQPTVFAKPEELPATFADPETLKAFADLEESRTQAELERPQAPATLGAGPRGRAGGNLQSAESTAAPAREPILDPGLTFAPPLRLGTPLDRGDAAPLWEESVAPVSPAAVGPGPNRLIPAHIDLGAGQPDPARAEAAPVLGELRRTTPPRDVSDLAPTELPSRSARLSSQPLPDARQLTPDVAARVLEALDQAPAGPDDLPTSQLLAAGPGHLAPAETRPTAEHPLIPAGISESLTPAAVPTPSPGLAPSTASDLAPSGPGLAPTTAPGLARTTAPGLAPPTGPGLAPPTSSGLAPTSGPGLAPPIGPGLQADGHVAPLEEPAEGPDRYGQEAPVIVPLSAAPSRLRFQATPDPEARALPTSHGLTEERAWLRASFSREFDAAASSVSRILSEHPGFQAGPDTMVDAVAVRLYLSELGEGLDAALRDGDIGPQVPFGRCVTGGLGRLPSHRGATVLCAELTADDVRAIREQRVLVDWGFTHALTEPPAGLPGNVDVLIWSMTARRTRLLEPGGDHHADGRAVFLPGTCFKVLDAAEPGPESRGHLLLRELSADEPDRGHVPFDDLALSSLRRAVEQWAVSNPRSHIGAASMSRFMAVPGLA